jgi:hypothetical protein
MFSFNYDLAPPKIYCRLPIADCRLPIADCRLPIADCRLPIADCRFTIHGSTYTQSYLILNKSMTFNVIHSLSHKRKEKCLPLI